MPEALRDQTDEVMEIPNPPLSLASFLAARPSVFPRRFSNPLLIETLSRKAHEREGERERELRDDTRPVNNRGCIFGAAQQDGGTLVRRRDDASRRTCKPACISSLWEREKSLIEDSPTRAYIYYIRRTRRLTRVETPANFSEEKLPTGNTGLRNP